MKDTPLIIQSDRTLMLDVHHPDAKACRNDLMRFCSLVKSPEHVHTYRIDTISLWNAAASGLTAEEAIAMLDRWSRYPIPDAISFFIKDIIGRYGKVSLTMSDDPARCVLRVESERIRREVMASKTIMNHLRVAEGNSFTLSLYDRGEVKMLMGKLGYPVDDRIPLCQGKPVAMHFRTTTKSGKPFALRDYQKEAAAALCGNGEGGTGFGVISLPCGSGKTVIGMAIMAYFQTRTLILTTNVAAVHQWMTELCDKMDIKSDMIGEYTGEKKETKPITVCTYQVLTWRPDKTGPFPHLDMVTTGDWGLIVYDEVHMLPAPVFKVTAGLQAVHRVGLTATLVREDGREDEVFSLVGPKRYDCPWDEIQEKGFIAEAFCHEIRVGLRREDEIPYAIATKREKYRIASENVAKDEVVKALIAQHPDDFVLVIGQYLDQLKRIAEETGYPLITGSTGNAKREELYNEFRSGKRHVLVVSKVANFAIDLPDASVAIQVSGTFGSRSEEAQRLGRILRPKEKSSHFYTLVTRYSSEEEFSANRQKFLAEQGYTYDVSVWGE